MTHRTPGLGDIAARRLASQPVLAVVIGLVGGIVAWFRLDGATRDTLWAEDGQLFLVGNDAYGPVDSVFRSYAGYLHVVPRLLSDVAAPLGSLEGHAMTVAALSCLTVGAISSLVFVCTHGVIESTVIRILVASVTVLVPSGPIETTGNLANLHWYFMWLAPWLLLARPSRWGQAIGLGVVGLLAGLTEIQVALFLPLMIFRLRDRLIWPAAVGLAVGALAQIVTSVTQPRPSPTGSVPGVLDQVQGYLLNVVVPLYQPSFAGPRGLLSDHGWWVAVVLAVPFVAALVILVVHAVPIAARRLNDPRVMTVAAILLGALVPFGGALFLNRQPYLDFDAFALADLALRTPLRYGVVPSMFLLAAVLLCLDLVHVRASRWAPAVVWTGMAGVLALLLWHVGPQTSWRSDGPRWSASVEAAQQACREGNAPPPVRVAPSGSWGISLTCDAQGRAVDPRPTIIAP